MAWHPAELRYRGRCSVEYFSQHPARQSGVQIWHVSEKCQRSPAVARQGGKTAFQRCRKAVAPTRASDKFQPRRLERLESRFDLVGVRPQNDGYALDRRTRSEEHTSELQSLMRISNAVLCLQKNHNI